MARVGLAILWVFTIALVASSVYLFLEVDRMRTDVARMRESVAVEVNKVREASSLLNSANRSNLDQLREEH